MRTEIVVAVKDSAQPTFEEIKEFESFSSKFAAVSSTPTVPYLFASAKSQAVNKILSNSPNIVPEIFHSKFRLFFTASNFKYLLHQFHSVFLFLLVAVCQETILV